MVSADEPVPLYHGTRKPFQRGGLILPRSQHGGPANHVATGTVPFADDAANWVYLTPDLDLAWDYAVEATGRGAPRVCEVAVWGDLLVDDSTVNGEDVVQFRCEAASVVRVLRERVG